VTRAEPAYGDILYSREGTYFGIAAEVPKDTRVCLGQRMVLIRPEPSKVDHRYLTYWLNSPQVAAHIQGFREGSVAERLNLPTIRGLPVFVPPLPQQRAIAGVLGALDDKIEQNRRTARALERLARATYRAWFVDFEPVKAKAKGRESFPSMPQDAFDSLPVRLANSEIGQVPEGWEVKPLAECIHVTMGQSPPSEHYNETGEGLPFHQGVTHYGFRFPTHRIYSTVDSRIAEPRDVLLSVRAPVGRINVADRQLVLGRGLAGLRHPDGRQSFLLHQICHVFAEEDAVGEGTIYNAITKQFLSAMPILLPSADTQIAFENLAQPLDNLVAASEAESRKLAEMRAYLMPRIMSGDVRVEIAHG
jgi:type I restriction enzyme S subunit